MTFFTSFWDKRFKSKTLYIDLLNINNPIMLQKQNLLGIYSVDIIFIAKAINHIQKEKPF